MKRILAPEGTCGGKTKVGSLVLKDLGSNPSSTPHHLGDPRASTLSELGFL